MDEIEQGQKKYLPTLQAWYTPFEKTLLEVQNAVPAPTPGEENAPKEVCPSCGEGELQKKFSKKGTS